jgi:hypothetical protein
MTNLTVRPAHSADRAAIERLAALDSASPPRGSMLVAEADSRMLAVLPLGSGRPIADPFEPTAQAVALLELRAAQLNGRREASRRAIDRLRALLRVPARA